MAELSFAVQGPDRLGRYELLRHLASGGMARVYLARVRGVGGFERHVVLKTIRAERDQDGSYLTMFLDEARLVSTLHHQHVAQVFDVGEADGTYYLAMEYVHGETVRAVLEQASAQRRPLPLGFGVTVACAAAAGLHHAHERRGADGQLLGIVHRDVSPSNVLVGYDGSIKLIDFGIAKAIERATHTQTGFVKGKAGYMAPEQALGYPVDRRSDVFALGVVVYELTTQARAFRAASEYETVERVVRGELTPPTELVRGYPPELEDVVMTALATDPDDRFQDADAMGRALELTAAHLGIPLGGPVVTRVLTDLFGARPEPWLAPPEEPDDTTVVETASLPAMAAARPAPVSPRAARPTAPGRVTTTRTPPPAAVVAPEPDEIPTCRFITADAEPPPARRSPPPAPPLLLPLASRLTPTPTPTPVPRPQPPPIPPRRVASGTAPATAPIAILPPPRPARPTRARRAAPWLLAAGGAAAVAAGVIAMLAGGDGAPAASPPALKPVEAPAAPRSPPAKPEPAPRPTAAPPDARLADEITVTITSDPDDATVVLDGERLGRTPLTTTVPRRGDTVRLKVRKRGHVTRVIEVSLDANVEEHLRLPRRR